MDAFRSRKAETIFLSRTMSSATQQFSGTPNYDQRTINQHPGPRHCSIFEVHTLKAGVDSHQMDVFSLAKRVCNLTWRLLIICIDANLLFF